MFSRICGGFGKYENAKEFSSRWIGAWVTGNRGFQNYVMRESICKLLKLNIIVVFIDKLFN